VVALMEAAKIYPLGEQANAKPMQYPDASGVPANMLPARDATAFDQLKSIIDTEGSNLADPDWLGMLAALGIVKGQPFNPDAAPRAIPDKAAKTAYNTRTLSPAATFASIPTAAGSIPSPTAPHRIPADARAPNT
jgi:hypothetical protein